MRPDSISELQKCLSNTLNITVSQEKEEKGIKFIITSYIFHSPYCYNVPNFSCPFFKVFLCSLFKSPVPDVDRIGYYVCDSMKRGLFQTTSLVN